MSAAKQKDASPVPFKIGQEVVISVTTNAIARRKSRTLIQLMCKDGDFKSKWEFGKFRAVSFGDGRYVPQVGRTAKLKIDDRDTFLKMTDLLKEVAAVKIVSIDGKTV